MPSVMTPTRLGRERIAPTMTTPTPAMRLGRALQMHRHVRAATARARTGPNNRSRPATPLARSGPERHLTALAERIAPPCATPTPSTMLRLGRHRVAPTSAPASAPSRRFGCRNRILAPASSTSRLACAAKLALAGRDHLGCCATLRRGSTMLPVTFSFPCHLAALREARSPFLSPTLSGACPAGVGQGRPGIFRPSGSRLRLTSRGIDHRKIVGHP